MNVNPYASSRVNQNLLDNAYFVNPVNQVGKTEYSGAGNSIDRVGIMGGMTLNVEDGGIRIQIDSATRFLSTVHKFGQTFAGKTLTASVLVSEVVEGTFVVWPRNAAWGSYGMRSTSTPGLVSVTFTVPESASNLFWLCLGRDDPAKLNVKLTAAKLEYGTEQTLARLENGKWVLNEIPDFGLELLKCQRYYQVFTSDAARPTEAEDFRPTMRIRPAKKTIQTGDKTLYIADANL